MAGSIPAPPPDDDTIDRAVVPRSSRAILPARRPDAARRPTIVLAVSGGLAAYQAAEVARLLVAQKAHVVPVMTRDAQRFLGAMTLSGLCSEPVRDELLDPSFAGELHVELARRADLILMVPATADLLARLAAGRADDLLTALALAARGPVLAAPAMHPRMWSHPAMQRNVALLREQGRAELVGPAIGEEGAGPLADAALIAGAALGRAGRRDLAPLRIVVTAGPTIEDFDPVRYLGNRSTGKMGFAIAERAAARGAEVKLVAGPVTLPTPYGVTRIDVRGALAMRSALWQAMGTDLGAADALIMSAAVADYRPAEERATKMKRTDEGMTLELVPNPDLLAEIGAARAGERPVLIGFAVETDTDDRVVAAALNKLDSKRVDLVVANHASDAFGRDDNRATLVQRDGAEALGVLSKHDLADRILDRVAAMCRS